MSSEPIETAGGFTIVTDRGARLIHYRMEGLWDLDTFQRYRDAMIVEMKAFQAAGLTFNALGDLTGFNAQRQDLNEERQDLVRTAQTMGLTKCAVIVSSSIVKLQLGRLSNHAYAFFTSKEEAKDWLAV